MLINLTQENRDILDIMAVENSKEYNRAKSLEECMEYAEAILKLFTKNEENPRRPATSEATKEFGDTIFRALPVLMNLNPDKTLDQIIEEVRNHIDYKLANLTRYYEENLYIGGL